jgi:hypothetical protein
VASAPNLSIESLRKISDVSLIAVRGPDQMLRNSPSELAGQAGRFTLQLLHWSQFVLIGCRV